ncbi:MAG: sulfatase [Bacteroidales bacterium]|nr:sulfatase [Bacteroidales bacterium]
MTKFGKCIKVIHTLKLLSILFAFLIVFTSCQEDKKEDTKPNIVLILVDDLGWKDTHTYGSDYYQTPNIDKLAEHGMTFTNAYASASNCAPSRACLLSGLYTPRHGIYTVNSSERGKTESRKLIPTPNEIVLHDSIITIAEVLKKAGYKTASIGKWHLAENPCTQGFDLNVGGNHLGHPKSYFSPYKNKDLPDGADGEYLTDRLTNEAIKFIKNNKDNKFFLYLPYFTVHSPLQAKKELIVKYKAIEGNEGQSNPVYAAMIETMDKNVGRIIATLDSLKLSENTLLIFSSDNGGVARISSQQPLRYGKGSYYEGGIRVPLIVSWPGKIKPKTKSDIPVSNIDFYPTLLEVTGIAEPISTKLDGQSLIPLFFGENDFDSLRAIFWHFPIYLQSSNHQFMDGRDAYFRTRPGSAVRAGNWKLHEYFEDGTIELYNLEVDPGEQYNLAEEYQEITKKLYQSLLEWRMETNASVPNELNPFYDTSFNTK